MVSMILDIDKCSVPCELYPSQSLRTQALFRNIPSLHWYVNEDFLWTEKEGDRFSFKVLPTYVKNICNSLVHICQKRKNIRFSDAPYFSFTNLYMKDVFRNSKWYFWEINVEHIFKKTKTKNVVKNQPPQRPTLYKTIYKWYIYIIYIWICK